MITIGVQVENPSGLHARPATIFTEAAAGFQSRITVENIDRGSRAVGRGVAPHAAHDRCDQWHRIRISADGPDAEAAVEKLRELVVTGFGEATEG
jgi:phosphotransferase system HPr-like phosphotransfer protein